MRLDAVPYLFERDGTNCENLAEGHQFLRRLRSHVDERFPNRMFLAEANQWPEDAVAYFGSGDEAHMAFHFPLMPRMFMAIRMEDRFPIVDILDQTPEIPASCQWALFLRNHDELTLEMVTDEERDYMVRVFAHDPQARINLGIRRRLAPLLGNDRRMIEMMNGLLFSLPGTPVVYYGDEIGMGDNIYLGDRNGVRTPMQWSADRNAGFSRANPQRLVLPTIIDPEYHSEAINVEAQQGNPHSLLWWTKRLIALRKRSRALSRGTLRMLYPENRKVLCFIREHEDERILVVANLSRLAQYVELDLSAMQGATPVELFGGTEFPRIGELPYLLTLGPHAFYWFSLEAHRESITIGHEPPLIEASRGWTSVLAPARDNRLDATLPSYLAERRWFGGKGKRVKSTAIVEAIPVHEPGSGKQSQPAGVLTFVRVEYTDAEAETYQLPVAAAPVERSRPDAAPARPIAVVHEPEGDRALYDAMWNPGFDRILLDVIGGRRRIAIPGGEIAGTTTGAYRGLRSAMSDGAEPLVMSAEQSNTSVLFDNAFVLKVVRRLEEGENPDLEIGRFLTDRAQFPHIPPVAGALELRRSGRPPITLGILQGFVPNEGDAWRFTLDALGSFTEHILTVPPERRGEVAPMKGSLLDLSSDQPPTFAVETIGHYLEAARLLGRRTAQLHLALASDPDDPAFAPEPFSELYQRSLYQSMRAVMVQTFQLVRRRAADVAVLKQILDLQDDIASRFHTVIDHRIASTRIRCHGDYHLGQVLYTGKDFVLIDFEGEPMRPLGVRRLKRSPLVDVAGMLRSFHYAAYTALEGASRGSGVVRPEDRDVIEPWLGYWYAWVSAGFLRAYLDEAADASFLPRSRRDLEVLLDAFMLEKALYELGYEINHRPEWVRVPVHGICQLMEVS